MALYKIIYTLVHSDEVFVEADSREEAFRLADDMDFGVGGWASEEESTEVYRVTDDE